MKNIVIIGAGQIGSRHLQAMVNLEMPARLQLVDPSGESLKVAQMRFSQVYEEGSKGIELSCYRSIDDLIDEIDLAIIATCSDVRAHIIKELIAKKKVYNIILEKVLFQRVADYYEINDLLKEKGIPTWVNCWMREKDFYKKLKGKLNSEEKVTMKVGGSSWLMGSSSVHFIDLFSFLTGCRDFNFISCDLDKEIIDSKRQGFKEFFGSLGGENSQGHSLILCRNKGKEPYKIEIINGSQKHLITDCGDHVSHKFFCKGNQSSENVSMPFQSQTTHRLVNAIVDNKKCDLSSYEDSMNLHLPFVKVLIEHLQNVTGEKIERCPIT